VGSEDRHERFSECARLPAGEAPCGLIDRHTDGDQRVFYKPARACNETNAEERHER
jgi:hypothetical protein